MPEQRHILSVFLPTSAGALLRVLFDLKAISDNYQGQIKLSGILSGGKVIVSAEFSNLEEAVRCKIEFEAQYPGQEDIKIETSQTSVSERVITSCPNYSQKLRTPSNLGELKLTCSKCKHNWLWVPKTEEELIEAYKEADRQAINYFMSQPTTPFLGTAVRWMYGNREVLWKGYSGKEPTFSAAKTVFIKDMRRAGRLETDEMLIKAFEDALNIV
jgi:hypothetical protein